ncbi:MAG: adenosylcobinamide-phosphate synthase CbiB [Verrucomicrobiota bacterium]
MNQPATILLIAFGLDLLLGDPAYPLHPVRLIGRLVQLLETLLRKHCRSMKTASFLLPAVAASAPLIAYSLLHRILGDLAWILDLYLVYSLLALRDLLKHGERVAFALKHQTLDDARNAVQMLVGRNTAELDAHAVARATIESVAENFVDGFLSPVFWFTAGSAVSQTMEGGVAALLGFKVISTLDSMVGYKNERYRELGRISAKFDDVLNFVPARLSIPLVALAARIVSKDWKSAWRIGLRDRLKHASPNSAHAEAAMAGALNLRLGGPTLYPHGIVEKPWLGNGTPDATPDHIGGALRISLWCGTIAIALVLGMVY